MISFKRQLVLHQLYSVTEHITSNSCNKSNLRYFSKSLHTPIIHRNRSLIKNKFLTLVNRNISEQKVSISVSNFYDTLKNSEAYSKTTAETLICDENLPSEVDDLIKKQWISMNNAELIKNFKILSFYASKNDQLINDSKYRGILEVLKDKCPNFIDDELRLLLSCLELWNIDRKEINFLEFWKIIDAECLKRRSAWTLDKILLTNDQFYRLRMSRKSEFSWNTLKKLGFKPKSMNSKNLIQYAFLLNVNRSTSAPKYELEYHLEKHADKFNVEEFGIIATTFFKMKTSIRSKNFVLKFMQVLIDNIDNVSDHSCGAIIDILKYNSDVDITNKFEVLFKTLQTRISHFSLRNLVKIIKLIGRIVTDSRQIILEILDRCEKEIENLTIKQIRDIVYTLYLLSYDFKTTPICSAILTELLNSKRIDEIERFPEAAFEIISKMLFANYYSEESLSLIMNPEFIKKFSNTNIHFVNKDYLTLQYCLEIEHPKYNGPKLENELHSYLLARHGNRYENVLDMDYHKKVPASISFLKDVKHTCMDAIGSNYIYVDAVLPHFLTNNIIIGYDPEKNTFISPENKLSEIPIKRIKYAPDDGKKWYILVLGTQRDLINNTHCPNGLLKMQMRHLKRIGYIPVLMTCYEWDNLSGQVQKQKYVRNTLDRYLFP